MKVKDVSNYYISSLEVKRYKKFESKGLIGKNFVIVIELDLLDVVKFKKQTKCIYKMTHKINDEKEDEMLAKSIIEFELLVDFSENNKVIELWKNDDKTFKKKYSGFFGNYIFSELTPLIGLIFQKMSLPSPIPPPYSPKKKNKSKDKEDKKSE